MHSSTVTISKPKTFAFFCSSVPLPFLLHCCEHFERILRRWLSCKNQLQIGLRQPKVALAFPVCPCLFSSWWLKFGLQLPLKAKECFWSLLVGLQVITLPASRLQSFLSRLLQQVVWQLTINQLHPSCKRLISIVFLILHLTLPEIYWMSRLGIGSIFLKRAPLLLHASAERKNSCLSWLCSSLSDIIQQQGRLLCFDHC